MKHASPPSSAEQIESPWGKESAPMNSVPGFLYIPRWEWWMWIGG